jgi:hypothetical protein
MASTARNPCLGPFAVNSSIVDSVQLRASAAGPGRT